MPVSSARNIPPKICPYGQLRFTFIVYAIGVDYAVMGFDTEVQPLVTHNAV